MMKPISVVYVRVVVPFVKLLVLPANKKSLASVSEVLIMLLTLKDGPELMVYAV